MKVSAIHSMLVAAPLAAVSSRPPEEEDHGLGTRETEVPVSAMKREPVVWSLRKTRWPRRTALIPFQEQLLVQF